MGTEREREEREGRCCERKPAGGGCRAAAPYPMWACSSVASAEMVWVRRVRLSTRWMVATPMATRCLGAAGLPAGEGAACYRVATRPAVARSAGRAIRQNQERRQTQQSKLPARRARWDAR